MTTIPTPRSPWTWLSSFLLFRAAVLNVYYYIDSTKRMRKSDSRVTAHDPVLLLVPALRVFFDNYRTNNPRKWLKVRFLS